MKKTVTILSAMLVCVAVFFCSPVYAATPQAAVYKQTTATNNGVQITVTASELYPETTTSLYGGVTCGVMVTVRMRNTGSTTKAVSPYSITLNVNTGYIVDYENLSPDLIVAVRPDAGGYISVIPSAGYSYNNQIIVPANSDLWMVCIVYFRGEFNTQNNGVVGVGLSSVSLSSFDVYDGDFPYSGNPVDLSAIEQSLTDLVFSGSMPGQLNPTPVAAQSPQYDYPDSGLHGKVYVYYNAPLRMDYEVETNASNDNAYQYGYIRYSGYIVCHYWNSSNDQYSGSIWLQMKNVLPNISGYPLIIDELQASNAMSAQVFGNTELDLILTNKNYTTGYYPARINEFAYLNFHYDIPINAWNDSTMRYSGTPDMTGFAGTIAVDNSAYYPVNEYYVLRDIYAAVSNNDSSLTNQSNDLTEDLNDAHTAEQNYFTNNSQALSNSGISNPNFEASDRTGINSAISGNKNTFGLLWNAIGAWRNVYIYAALLGLVTYLLRHKPWISGGKKQWQPSNHSGRGSNG